MPVGLGIKKHKEINCKVCLTGQHRQMLDQVMDAFSVGADYDLNIMKDRQTLTTITTSVMEGLEPILIEEKPDVVLVHGDTTTSYAAALAAFYQQIPVGHVEPGLRTGDIYSPFPEEMNRLLTDRISTYYFAPTQMNEKNLADEGITENVVVTGNTVIDAFKYTVKDNYEFKDNSLNSVDFTNRRIITLTAHRRVNMGEPLRNICNAVKRMANEYPDVVFIYPVHLNPAVRDVVFGILSNIDNVLLIDPVDVLDMHKLLARSYMVMTDSDGLQEEAPHFGKPVLVLRTETERPEAVEAGTVKVIGVEEDAIYQEAKMLLDEVECYQKMAKAVNPYGDGHASERIVQELSNIVI
ncbi:non-hydrolyzing UDP-N-acetylglucosamine 2-epimerase [Butyrivibrio sp. AE3006]|uniref:non-hydrolyzing UDP-N-acetylglucosamine 2-epimerase n=1 Tax=Butyrivibrio sp. AE3006 TaxID=1280673 RepID=UPI002E8E1151|nr:UDP-N-acetylglucosamine 2-epimerase (non-hydrolyzing) [Butyrivibrio sp. AE3006]